VAAALGGAFLQGRKRLVQAVNLALLLGAWFIIFALNQELSLKRWLRFEGVFTLVSEDETAAARFLDQPRYRQTLLVAEPATQHILEGLSGVNTAGGTYATAATRGQLMDILGSDSPEHVREPPSSRSAMLCGRVGRHPPARGRSPRRPLDGPGRRRTDWRASRTSGRRDARPFVTKPA
jgi:hypothetical protein